MEEKISDSAEESCVSGSKQRSTLLYNDRPEWKDVQPIYTTEEEEAVVRIAVTDECLLVYSLKLL
jgi:hypothetical protein